MIKQIEPQITLYLHQLFSILIGQLNLCPTVNRLFDGCEFFFIGLSPKHQPLKNLQTKLVQLAGE